MIWSDFCQFTSCCSIEPR